MRILLAFIGAPIVAFSLFIFMAGLIYKDLSALPKSEPTPYFDLVMSEQQEHSERKIRQKPIQPQVQPVAAQQVAQPQVKPQTPKPVAAKLEAPKVNLTMQMSAVAISMPNVVAKPTKPAPQAVTQPVVSEPVAKLISAPVAAVPAPITQPSAGDTMAVPLHRVEPDFPIRAQRRGKEGYVIVSYDISTSGRAINVKIIEAKPKRTFEKAVKKAMKKWKFKPLIVDGKAQMQTQQRQRFEFKMRQ
ncbi:TonB family protein [Motilimonas eburnea]|uniref:TonB family protein n=1 Tax=Motilimonas eburnea TaxID=1737488 RepID=UPI001E6371E4|nr:TonB family protein [Motilimonas eburnea]MCE2570722.1 TonB family protein [Motilimonas eburnea]